MAGVVTVEQAYSGRIAGGKPAGPKRKTAIAGRHSRA